MFRRIVIVKLDLMYLLSLHVFISVYPHLIEKQISYRYSAAGQIIVNQRQMFFKLNPEDIIYKYHLVVLHPNCVIINYNLSHFEGYW